MDLPLTLRDRARLRDRAFVALCVGAIVLGLTAIARADELDRRVDPDAVELGLVADGIAEATDAARAAAGLPPLPRDGALERAAMEHAARMVEHDFYDHTDPFDPARRGPGDRARRAGVTNPMAAENIHDFRLLAYDGGPVYALGGRGRFSHEPDGAAIPTHTYRSFGREVVAEWLASPGHRRNLLDPEATAIGYGAAPHWQDDAWPHLKAVQLFQLYEAPRHAVAQGGARPAPPQRRLEPEERHADAPAPARQVHQARRAARTGSSCHRARPRRHARQARAERRVYDLVIDGVRYQVVVVLE